MAQKLSCVCALGGFGFLASCSSPVPPPAQGALSLYFTTVANSMAGMSCPAGAHWVNVPFNSAGGQHTNSYSKGDLAVDGANQMQVTCSVRDNGGGAFAVNGTMKSPSYDAMGNPDPVSTLASFATTITDGQSGAMATVTLIDNKTTSQYSSTACTASVAPANTGDQLGVAPGRIWAAVTCPKFRDEQNPDQNAICSIATGYIVLENCLQ